MRLAALLLGALAVGAVLSVPALAQKKKAGPTDPSECPYCKGDPEKMKAGGIVSHGPFPFAKKDTAAVEALLPTSEIRWVETDFFRIGFGLREYKVKVEEKKKMVAELTRLKQFYPEIKPDTGVLDPWLRVHMFAQRAQDSLDDFLKLINGKDSSFGAGAAGAYRGEGRYLGMKEKYEWLVLRTQAAHTEFLTENFGLQLRVGHREHHIPRGVLGYYCHAQEGGLREDSALHGNLVFNLTHNFLDGLNHYNYDTPVWFHEGFAHWREREINPNYNTFDSGEGAVADMTSKSNWRAEVLALVSGGDAPRMAELVALKSYAELKLPHHYATWSIVDFMIQTRPEAFGGFVWALKSNLDSRGVPTGENLPEHVRTKFKELFGMGYTEFDEAWRTWVRQTYKAAPPKSGGGLVPGGSLNPNNPLGG